MGETEVQWSRHGSMSLSICRKLVFLHQIWGMVPRSRLLKSGVFPLQRHERWSSFSLVYVDLNVKVVLVGVYTLFSGLTEICLLM